MHKKEKPFKRVKEIIQIHEEEKSFNRVKAIRIKVHEKENPSIGLKQ